MFLKLFRHQRLQASQLDLVVHLILQLLLVSRHIGLPALNSRLEFQKRATSRRNDRAEEVSLPSSCCRIISLLQPPPCLQWVLPFTKCAHSVRTRTDTTLDQDCVLKATVQVCTACKIVSFLTTCMNFNTSPLAQVASQTRKHHPTKKLRKHVCQLISCLYNSTFPSMVNCILTIPECRCDHHGSCTSTAWSRKCVCSLCHPRASLGF